MAIRFKFRSSVQFDSVDIDDRPSISVRDLRSKIVRHKKLNSSQDLDLVFSDAVTGREYNEENFQIPSGSSIIIKRVPAGLVHTAARECNDLAEDFKVKNSKFVDTIGSSKVMEEMNDFDDFGVDLCPVPEVSSFDCELDLDKRYCSGGDKTNDSVPRGLGAPMLRCQMVEVSDVSEAFPKDGEIERNTLLPKSNFRAEEELKLEKGVVTNPPQMQTTALPSEMKCSLCDTFFKEAVMIPCCQHSFCEKCIRTALVNKARCPKCSSTKCRVEDLLPNLSLRQAIDHFLDSQNLLSGSESAFHRDAPDGLFFSVYKSEKFLARRMLRNCYYLFTDGESGIQARDISCAMSNFQREPDLSLSPSTTGMGSNQIVAESAYDSVIRNNAHVHGTDSRRNHLGASKSKKSATFLQKRKYNDEEGGGSNHPVVVKNGPQADFQGENQPVNLPQTRMHEADFTIKRKRELHLNFAGGDRSFVETAGRNKDDRTCYMCGSPNHFIRDCPAASSPHPMLPSGNPMFPGAIPGYVSPHWNSTSFPYTRPFAHPYCNPGIMPFHAAMVPGSPFAVSPYMTSMYGGTPVLGGYMRMGALPPPLGTSAEHPLSRSVFEGLQECEKRWKQPKENMGREHSCNDEDDGFDKSCRYSEMGRLQDHNSHRDPEKSLSFSEDSFTQRSQRKHRRDKHYNDDFLSADDSHEKSSHSSISGRDRRPRYPKKSSSVVEDVSNSSNCCTEERHRYHHRGSKKHNERRGHCSSDSIRSHLTKTKERNVKHYGVDNNVKRHNEKYSSLFEPALEASVSSDRKERRKEKDSSHSCRISRHKEKYRMDELNQERWQMVSGSDEICRDHYHPRKRKKVH